MVSKPEHHTGDPGPAAHPPLLSWDIFLNRYRAMMQLLDDAQLIYHFGQSNGWQHHWDFRKVLLEESKTILVTQKDLTIVCASSNIMDMTGYYMNEVIGKTPRFFQGAATQAETRQLIRHAVQEQLPFEATLINYKKSGDPYDCYIQGFPVFNSGRELCHFIAFEQAV